MLKGFKEFIAKGSVIDLAVGVIIGAAFGAIVESLVKDLLTPGLGALGGIPDFSAYTVGPLLIGNFVNALIAFLLKALALYVFIVMPFNKFRAQAPPAGPTREEQLLVEIRDLLARR